MLRMVKVLMGLPYVYTHRNYVQELCQSFAMLDHVRQHLDFEKDRLLLRFLADEWDRVVMEGW